MTCAALPLKASAGTRLDFTQNVSVSSDHEHIRAVVSATGDDGQPIRGLTLKHFAVSVDGEPGRTTRVLPVAANDQPVAIVLAIDISKSMAGSNAFAAARSAAARLVDELGSADLVAIVTFGTSATRILDFTLDKAKARKALEQLNATDNQTLLYEGLLQSAQQATLATTGKAVVIAVTDGKDEGSNVTLEDVVGKAKSSGVAVYTLGFGQEEDSKTLARISELTGGQYRHAVKPQELPDLYQSILDVLKNAYALTVDVKRVHSGIHNVSVTLSYREKKVSAAQEFRIPLPPLPRWLWFTAGSVVVLLVLLTVAGWIFTRRTRAKKRMHVAPALPPIWVDVVEGSQRGRRVRLLGRRLRIGGAADCELRSDDARLAPYQAEIISEPGGAALQNGGDGNTPMLLNGNSLRPNQSVRLRSGDRIKTGSMVVVFMDQRRTQPTPTKSEERPYAVKGPGPQRSATTK